jgi:hypothetical protein
MRFHREEYVAIMAFGHAPRPMFVELFGKMVGVAEEWAAQGAGSDEIDLAAFEWDYVPVVQCGAQLHVRGGWKETVVEETEEYVIRRDPLGRRLKLYKSVSSIPLPLDYPVHDFDSWLALKPLFAFHEDRIDLDAVDRARKAQSAGALVVGLIPGGFDIPRQLMGAERACLCYYDQPELMHDICGTITDTALKVFERITDLIRIDQLSVHEDMAGKTGPLIGPKQVESFIAPYYRRVWDLLSSRGTRLFDMDTDGNVEDLIDIFLDAGLTGLAPNEPAAGVDTVALRKKYGRRLALKGGIDKFVLLEGPEAIRRELEYKMQPLMRAGGAVFGIDHRIPKGVTLENYRYYVDTGREILGLPPRTGRHREWRRMAF